MKQKMERKKERSVKEHMEEHEQEESVKAKVGSLPRLENSVRTKSVGTEVHLTQK